MRQGEVWGTLLAAGALGAACSGAPEKSGLPVANATARAQPAGTSSSVASASATSPLTPPKKTEVPFVSIGALPEGGDIYALGDALVVAGFETSDPGDGSMTSGIAFSSVDGDKIVPASNRYLKLSSTGGSVTFGGYLVALYGRWPSTATAFITGSNGRTPASASWSYDGVRWTEASGHTGSFVALAPYRDGAIGATAMLGMADARLEAFNVQVDLPAATPIDKKACVAAGVDADAMPATTEVLMSAVGATHAGTIFSVGARCTGDLAVETWPSGAKKSTIQTLEKGSNAASDFSGVATGAGNDAWIYASHLHHYDGSTWSVVQDAPTLKSASVASDGTLWGIDAVGRLFKGGVNGLVEVAVPNDVPIRELAVTTDGTVWLAAGGTLLRTKHANDRIEKVELTKKKNEEPKPISRIDPGGKDCKYNVVILYEFANDTPNDYDFPATRAALKGHAELAGVKIAVTRDNGHRYLSAFPKTFSEAHKIAAIIENGVQGAKPEIVCRQPELVRFVNIDMTSGALVK